MMTVLGIDPGVSGAVARVSDDGARVWSPEVYKEGSRTRISPLWVRSVLLTSPQPTLVVMERQSTRPGEAGVASFSAGWNAAVYHSVAQILGLRFEWVAPPTWKARFSLLAPGLTPAERKSAALQRARELWPDLADDLKRVSDHGRADALLIAEWARTKR